MRSGNTASVETLPERLTDSSVLPPASVATAPNGVPSTPYGLESGMPPSGFLRSS